MSLARTIGIIGAGKLAKALLINPVEGFSVKWLYMRPGRKEHELQRLLTDNECGAVSLATELEGLSIPDMLFIAVSDNALQELSANLADKFGDGLAGRHVVHFSGINTVDILDACRRKNAIVHKMHPYQTFFYPEPGIFNGIFWGVQSSGNQENILDYIAKSGGYIWDMNSFGSTEHIKYHASAVIASNFTNIVIAYSKKILHGLSISSEIIFPIINRTIANAFKGKDFPLTGPIARGDTITLQKHLEALEEDDNLKRFYLDVSEAALSLIEGTSAIDEQKINEIRHLLEKYK